VRVVVEADHPTFEPARDQNIQRETPVATRPHDGQSYTLIEGSFLNLNLRFSYASSGLRLGYGTLLSTLSSAPIQGIVASALAPCAYPYILRKPETDTTSGSAWLGKECPLQAPASQKVVGRQGFAAWHL
jgi:hypothetical protein